MPQPEDHASAQPSRAPRRSLGRGPGAGTEPAAVPVAGGEGEAPEELPSPAPSRNRREPPGPSDHRPLASGAQSATARPPAQSPEPNPGQSPSPAESAAEAEPAPEPEPWLRPAPEQAVSPVGSAVKAEHRVRPAAGLGSVPEPEAEAESGPGPVGSVAEAVAGSVPGASAGGTSGRGAGGLAPVSGRGGVGDEPPAAGDGRFTVRLANFEGPFDLLLQLISKHKMDVTEVALSKVTDEFMAHIRAMGADWDLDQTTEFLVVAATLLDLKAARLLPAAEVEDEADLALLEARDLLFARLLQYRAYKQIADIFSARLDAEGKRYPRTVGLEPHHAELLPEVVISIGAEGFARLAVKAMQPRAEPQVYIDHIHAPLVSVREQADVVVARLREHGEASFRTLTEDAPDTLTVVARFLALLELYREKAVVLDQDEALGPLMVRWTGGDGAQPAVTDEFDQEDPQNKVSQNKKEETP
ncbi:segregation/condensation protein A [Streptomyces sp. A3M-1-3]|uniref:segregation/condensation protein A n=1 Tax=Streptomyces sp. A3M-1-3 TaxID=2962044 RepID=UPI0020B677AF|nr:segregation/condensation protein A [Streptomyces sp. A3M-1-3]MCP3821950.1 segregation/condensation protein A [Streptomyces sp. A3M-1-3]